MAPPNVAPNIAAPNVAPNMAPPPNMQPPPQANVVSQPPPNFIMPPQMMNNAPAGSSNLITIPIQGDQQFPPGLPRPPMRF